ncbi:FKBP-type peptidyl-prolyl cis-trans isomerase [Pseudobutyrivibrio sp.]|uniref:FKBP-type peptidyl-prolyl cis-trans isomerase n=1 Tax=Pseudobutyrivibrio sp. TaxID=2014367 RepID=UPI0025DA99B0|nr:FKBP-type peptidyl-prolyl cis-trans isomerase [Pseudobutyrivibrio sp.]MBR5649041.1 FKBP-type peptidyl-prolyl cis-trans isomerase [Pseudobutyrivibrio sp.]
MKKKLFTVLLCTALAVTAVACKKEIKYTASDIVKLGQYKGMEITLYDNYEFTEEGFNSFVENSIQQQGIFIQDDSLTTVEEDSIVNVDYVGSQDGVAFDGGSAEDQMLDIANNSAAGGQNGYIPGFTSGLVGHEVGEEVAYEVTFPEDYGNADLAGQTVIFTFQINYIANAIDSKDKLTDDIVAEKIQGYSTVDEYLAALEEQYKSNLETSLANDKETAILNAIENGNIGKVEKVPDDLLQARVDMILLLQNKQYEAYGTTMEEYVTSIGYDYEDVLADLKSNVKKSTETELILEAIADAEDIQLDDDYDAFVQNIYTQMGYSDAESFYDDLSVEGYDGERYFQLAYRTEKVVKWLAENCVVSFEEPEVVEDVEITDDEAAAAEASEESAE